MKELLIIAIGSAIVNNVVLSQFLGICPFLGVSKKVETATGMGGAVVFVITLSSFFTGLIYKFILVPLGFEYLQTIVFILFIAALVQFVEMFLKKSMPSLVQCTWCVSSTDHNKLCGTWCGTYKRSERIFYLRRCCQWYWYICRIPDRDRDHGRYP